MTKASTHQSSAIPVTTAGAYSANDQVGGLMTLKTGVDGKHPATLLDIKVLDKASQKAALVIWFFSKVVSVAGDNAAHSVSDADMAFCLGHRAIPETKYADTALNAFATDENIGLGGLAPDPANGTNGTIYALIETTGTPTYGSTSDLKLDFYFAPDTN